MQAIERGQAINITNDSNLGVKEQPSSPVRYNPSGKTV